MGRSRSVDAAARGAWPSRHLDGVADLTRHGLIVAQPRSAKAATNGSASAGKECWQSDWTGWHLADGTDVAIAGTLDDRARYAARTAGGIGRGTAELVRSVMLAGITECGIRQCRWPTTDVLQRSTARLEAAFEANLRALGTHTANSAPTHPQTCGRSDGSADRRNGCAPARLRPPSTNSTPARPLRRPTTTTDRTARCAGPLPPTRSPPRKRPACRPAAAAPARQPPRRRPDSPASCRRALQGQRRTALGGTNATARDGDHIAISAAPPCAGIATPPTTRRRKHANLPHGEPPAS